MAFIDDTWLRKAHQALRQTFEVDSATRNEMIQFLFDEGFWDPEKLKWESAVSRFNDNCNPTKETFWKLGEIWALMLRFGRHQLLHAMAESLGYELRAVPTEERRIALLEQILALQMRYDETQADLRSEPAAPAGNAVRTAHRRAAWPAAALQPERAGRDSHDGSGADRMPVTQSTETLEPRYKVDVILWAIGRRHPITTAEIRARWGVHKATACRWVHDLNDARQRAQCTSVPRAEPTRAPVAMQEARTQ